jgi:PTS system ascorbate-specific IIA component
MLIDILTEEMVALDVDGLTSPQEVILYSGSLLVKAGKVKESYVKKMVEAYETIGPYIVMTPGIALPHAKPSSDVLEPCIAFVRLKNPVAFHHTKNDPVKLVFALGGVEHDGHLDVLESLSGLLGNEKNIEKLYTIASYKELAELMSDIG